MATLKERAEAAVARMPADDDTTGFIDRLLWHAVEEGIVKTVGEQDGEALFQVEDEELLDAMIAVLERQHQP